MNYIKEQLMKPEDNSFRLLSITRSKAKMYEYGIPEEHHIQIFRDPARLFPLTIGILGDLAAQINGENQDLLFDQELKILCHFQLASLMLIYMHC